MLDLIRDFLKQIKNLLFLELTDQIVEYYWRFEEIIKKKEMIFEKYSYFRKVFEIYLNHDQSSLFLN